MMIVVNPFMANPEQVCLRSERKNHRVLVVEDQELHRFIADAESTSGFELVRINAEELLGTALRDHFDLIITSPSTPADADIALIECLQKQKGPGVKVIIVASAATPKDVIAALRAHAFGLFTVPFDYGNFVSLIEAGVSAPLWSDGIEVVSAKPDWIGLRVRCSLITANRLLQYGHELKVDLPEELRDTILLSFRELLLNAMEYGGRFNPLLKVDVGYLRTESMILYYVRDPGSGFDTNHAKTCGQAASDDPMACVALRIEQGLRPGGFGIHLASQMLDSLVYNQYGNEVVLIKNLR